MKYQGYTGIVELDEESETFFGRVIGLRDVITFQGESVAEIIQAFHDSVDDYLEFCGQRGESPEKPYSGETVLRTIHPAHRPTTPPRDGHRGGGTEHESERPGREHAQERFPHSRTGCEARAEEGAHGKNQEYASIDNHRRATPREFSPTEDHQGSAPS
jgi:predicted HicB family RNase H-like nuclease